MSQKINEIIGQNMIIGLSGKSLTPDEEQFIVENNIGGIILFDRNIESPKQLHELNSHIQSLRFKTSSKAPIIISIDMEGGRVARLKAPFTQWPPIAHLGEIDSAAVAFKLAQYMGTELRSVGINMDFAPCTDVFTNPKNEVIGDRAISSDPEQVAKIGSALVRGYIKSNVMACAKHFPGHGNTLLDSHEDLPVEDIDESTLTNRELIPFKKVFRARLDFVMTAHILFKEIDPEWPVTLSQTFLKNKIRDLGYKGLIITDDLDMKALANNYSKEEIPVLSLKAGANVLLYCNEPDSPQVAIDSITESVANGSLAQEILQKNYSDLLKVKKVRLKNPDPLSMEEVSRVVGQPEHLNLAKAIKNKNVPEDMTQT